MHWRCASLLPRFRRGGRIDPGDKRSHFAEIVIGRPLHLPHCATTFDESISLDHHVVSLKFHFGAIYNLSIKLVGPEPQERSVGFFDFWGGPAPAKVAQQTQHQRPWENRSSYRPNFLASHACTTLDGSMASESNCISITLPFLSMR